MKLFILLNHALTQEQMTDLESMGVEEMIYLDRAHTGGQGESEYHTSAQQVPWAQIPPQARQIAPLLEGYCQRLQSEARRGDYLLVQGDFGATYIIVECAKSLGLIPIYATTLRESREHKAPDGSISKQSLFKHCLFRIYGE